VFQIAAHVDVVPLEQLYEWCQIARDILRGEHAMARVIARPFSGPPGAFVRTKDRRDFSLAPPAPTYLDLLHEVGAPVIALGKISEIFVGRGVSKSLKVGSNAENLALLLDLLTGRSDRVVFADGLLFTNLVDFDMVWGHRNDPDGFAAGLEEVDRALPQIVAALRPGDRLIISADHGVDPTTASTDHSREYVPLLYYPRPEGSVEAVFEGTFSDTGATVFAHLTGREAALAGRTFESQHPARGWSRYTPTLPSPLGEGQPWPVRVGLDQAREAARWLQTVCGDAPEAAVIVGSGQSDVFHAASPWKHVCGPFSYDQIPWWRAGSVAGHTYQLEVVRSDFGPLIVLNGRVHSYEGFDLGELQLPVRTLAAWGVKNIVLTCAAGGLSSCTTPGTVVVVREIIDCQYLGAQGDPNRLLGTDAPLAARLLDGDAVSDFTCSGVYAAVPGPQYETEAENELLRGLGADCVGMSLAAEVRAAREAGLGVAVFALVTNAGPTAHDSVLAAATQHSSRLLWCVLRALSAWNES
jgi:purine nucleoside phosphorylase